MVVATICLSRTYLSVPEEAVLVLFAFCHFAEGEDAENVAQHTFDAGAGDEVASIMTHRFNVRLAVRQFFGSVAYEQGESLCQVSSM